MLYAQPYTVGTWQQTRKSYLVPLATGTLVGLIGYLSSALFKPSKIPEYKNTKILVASVLADTLISGSGATAVTVVSKMWNGALTGGQREWWSWRTLSMLFLGGFISALIKVQIDRALIKYKGDPETGTRGALLFPLKEVMISVAEKDNLLDEANELMREGQTKAAEKIRSILKD